MGRSTKAIRFGATLLANSAVTSVFAVSALARVNGEIPGADAALPMNISSSPVLSYPQLSQPQRHSDQQRTVQQGDRRHVVGKASDTVPPLAPVPAPLATGPLPTGFHNWNVQPMRFLAHSLLLVVSESIPNQLAKGAALLLHHMLHPFANLRRQ